MIRLEEGSGLAGACPAAGGPAVVLLPASKAPGKHRSDLWPR